MLNHMHILGETIKWVPVITEISRPPWELLFDVTNSNVHLIYYQQKLKYKTS